MWSPTRLQVNGEFALEPSRGRAFYSCRNFAPLELSFGFKPADVAVSGGVNGIPSTVKTDGQTLHVGLNGVAEVVARA